MLKPKRIMSLTLALVVLAASVLPMRTPAHAAAEGGPAVVLASDYEDGTAQGWTKKGDEQLTVTKEVYHGGSYSLYVDGRTKDWEGPNQLLSDQMTPNTAYTVGAWVKSPAPVKFTVHTKIGEAEDWKAVAELNGGQWSEEWTYLEGTYITGDKVGFTEIYAEAAAGTAFYLDDIKITAAAVEVPDGEEGLRTDFEDGTLQGWKNRIGPESLSVSQDTANTGTHSMLVEGRERSFYGPSLSVKEHLRPGKSYQFSLYVRLKEKPEADKSLQMTVYKKAGSESWNAIDKVSIKADEWDQWHLLKGNFQYSDQPSELNLFVETPYITEDTVDTLSFYVDDVTAQPATELSIEQDIPSLKDIYAGDFAIGAAAYSWQMEGVYGELLKKHFNSITATYEMKPKFLAPSEGTYVFDGADKYVEFAQANGMGLRGHALLWHVDAAEWMFTGPDGQPASRELLLTRLQSYIETVMHRYNGKIYAWDVVNEAIADNGGGPDGMRITPWYTLIGPDYIEKAFEFARAADPEAKLYYNDYYTEVPEKREHIYKLLKTLKAKNLIDGVGLQSHHGLFSPSISEIEKTIQQFSQLGLDIQITELDVDSGISPSSPLPPDIAARQGKRYNDLFELYKKYKDTISSVSIWGVQDEKSYNNHAMLFDEQLKAKPAYWGAVDPSKLPAIHNVAVALEGTPQAGEAGQALWSKTAGIPLEQGSTVTAKVHTLWDTNNLYVKADVTDASRNAEDKVELFLDENNGKTTAYQPDDRKISLPRSGSGTEGVSFTSTEREGGYIIEARIPLITVKGSAGAELGLDIRVSDASVPGSVPAYWNDRSSSQDTDTSRYGVLQLSAMPNSAESVKGQVQIDGQMDAVWEQAKPFEVKLASSPYSTTAEARSMWSEDSLYLIVDVKDALLKADAVNPWDQDSVEIFIDENFNRTPYYEGDDGQYRININNVASFGGGASDSRLTSAVVHTDTGYRVEAKINFGMIKAKAGSSIGLDLQINDDRGDGTRSTSKWNDRGEDTWRDTSNFGILTFVAPAEGPQAGTEGTSPSPSSGSAPSSQAPAPAAVFADGKLTVQASPDKAGILHVNLMPEAVRQAVLQSLDSGILKIAVKPAAGAEMLQLGLPLQSLAAQPKIKEIQIESGFGAVLSLNTQLLKLQDTQAGDVLQLQVKRVAQDGWPAAVKARLNGAAVLDFSLTIHGAKITAVDATALTLLLPYELKSGERAHQLVVYQVLENGRLVVVKDRQYDPATGYVSFKTKELGQYVVATVKLPDHKSSKWAAESVEALAAKGILPLGAEASYETGVLMSRAEFAQLLVDAFDLQAATAAPGFKDVSTDSPYAEAINITGALGIVKGRADGLYSPNATLSRQEMAVMLNRLVQLEQIILKDDSAAVHSFKDLNQLSAEASGAIEKLRAAGVIQGAQNGNFLPKAQMTKEQAALVVYRIISLN
ncbi:endo-1,4-beta-xylanase [Paenibacillus sp. FSL R7-277]|uniref:endo-1,4-beta-xylanase n=1 Tax=unclassified Paenibacillus TaxID=185978 RepID=UPI0003E24032|nr:endo-1,4-beta-xylanase [Paenibacillus sp. FSL R7-277]ETT74681.1 endo-1,4-beta-xylanase [Paenibacillus sp. FSL R7-277]